VGFHSSYPAPHDPPAEATVPLTTFIYTTVGLSVAVVVMGVAVGVVTGLATKWKRAINNSAQSPVSSVGGDICPVVVPEYEEISLHEAKNIHLTDNAAYGYNS
jgi:hypothetical protein